jgi:flavin reductase (DIM6/NTAB) family NADH-FMN oxidoreductase RutF
MTDIFTYRVHLEHEIPIVAAISGFWRKRSMLGTTDEDIFSGLSLATADVRGPHIDPRTLRDALGCFTTGVTVVTARGRNGRPMGVTVNSFNSLSLDPPLVLWSLSCHSATYSTFVEANHFAVHVLCEGQEHLCRQFARSGIDRFTDVELGEGLGGVPVVPEVAALFECRSLYRYWGGDHVIFIGRVDRCQKWPERRPLVFHQGQMKRLVE